MTQKTDGAIPFVDLVALHREIQPELVELFKGCLNSASFIGGPLVKDFEHEFAAYCRTSRCVGVGSGTDALRFALIAAGVQPGDIVITVPFTFIATAEAISQAGARPVFVDIDPVTYTMDPQKLQSYLENECLSDPESGKCFHRELRRPVSAVVPVHLYGQMADMDPILALAKRYHLRVIEDACQGHGAKYFSKAENRWCTAGSMGDAAAFSFYPGKNLGACGEGGAITTNDETIAAKAGMLRDHGQSKKYYHDMEGYNGRLDAIQAGILSVKLRNLNDGNDKRRQAAQIYDEMLAGTAGLLTPQRQEWARSVYHLYVIRVRERDKLQIHLEAAGIGAGIHYPHPLHLQKAYAGLGYGQKDFPMAETVASEVLSLPMYPHLETKQQDRVSHEVRRFLSAKGSSASETAHQPAMQLR